jgi:hypothetical protein
MTGFDSKRQMAQDRLDDDDIQVYAQPAQEPVVWTGVDFDIKTAPPKRPWVGLTDDERFAIGEKLGLADVAWLDLMQAIETALRSKNT